VEEALGIKNIHEKSCIQLSLWLIRIHRSISLQIAAIFNCLFFLIIKSFFSCRHTIFVIQKGKGVCVGGERYPDRCKHGLAMQLHIQVVGGDGHMQGFHLREAYVCMGS